MQGLLKPGTLCKHTGCCQRFASNLAVHEPVMTGLSTANNQVQPLQQEQEPTFYRRELPATMYSFTSPRGKDLFKRALATGHAEGFFHLSGQFAMQSEPAFWYE